MDYDNLELPYLPRCPRCGSSSATKSGKRFSRPRESMVQQFKCRACGANFIGSDPKYYRIHEKNN